MSASFLKTVSAIQYVWLGVSIFLLILLILSRTEIFRNALSQSRYTKKELFIFTAVFSILGFCGTLWNFQTPGGIMGFRHIFIILSGFIGGPVVGTLTGLIVGIFRTFTIHTDYAQINGSLSMLQGIAAGLIAMRLKRHGDDLWAWSIIYSALIEVVYWSLYTFVTWPYVYNNVEAVVSMIFTIIITNVPAIGLFFLVLEKTVKSKEREKSETIRNAFNSANRLIHSIHDSTKGPDNSKIPDIIISGLPNLIWAAIITPYSIHFSTNYKNNTHESQGEAETSILQIQRELPTNPHLCKITIQGNGDPTYIYVSKPSDTVISKTDLEFLNGLAQIIKLITEYSELLKEEKLLQEAEIKTLQAQINPHFLYNTLNTIHFYVRDDPETARKLIRYLSDYFRRSLSNPDRLIPLAEEIKDINAYVELEKARFADRLSVTFDFPEKLVNQVEVPPLLFQPLVENAIIHGVLDKPEDGLEAAKVINRMKMPVRIVFATGFSQFALEAFDLEAFDYIMKPYNGERIARTLQRFRDSQQLLSQEEKEGEIVASPEFISLKTKGRTVRLSPQKDIFLIATEKTDSTLFYTREGIIRSFMTLREAEKTLTPLGFFRTHKGFIVNLSKIHEIQPQDNGTLLLTMTRFDKLKVPVSRHYIKPF